MKIVIEGSRQEVESSLQRLANAVGGSEKPPKIRRVVLEAPPLRASKEVKYEVKRLGRPRSLKPDGTPYVRKPVFALNREKRWSAGAEKLLLRLLRQGKKWGEIGREIGRSSSGARQHYEKVMRVRMRGD